MNSITLLIVAAVLVSSLTAIQVSYYIISDAVKNRSISLFEILILVAIVLLSVTMIVVVIEYQNSPCVSVVFNEAEYVPANCVVE